MTVQTAIAGTSFDRFAAMLAAPRSRRGFVALGAVALTAVAPVPALARAHRTAVTPKRGVSRDARIKSPSHAAAVTTATGPKMPVLDGNVFAASPALNEFNLLMNQLIRNYDTWLAAIAAPVATAKRQKTVALGLSVAADLGRIADHEKTFLAGGATAWTAGGAKMKEWGVDAELRKLRPGLSVDGVMSLLSANFGESVGGVNVFYSSAKSSIAAEISLIRKQAEEIGRTGVVTARTPMARAGALRRSTVAGRICKLVVCILTVLATVGILLGAAAVVACVVSGLLTGPAWLAVCLGIIVIVSAVIVYNLDQCLSASRC